MPNVSNDNLWDLVFTETGSLVEDQLLCAVQLAQSGSTIHPDDWPEVKQKFLNHMLGKSDVFCHQYRVVDEAGNERWVQSQGKIIEQNSTGQPKRMVGTQTDITERKTAELTLQLEHAEQQAHLGHWYIDSASRAFIWSQEMFRIFEREADDFIPDLKSYIQLVHPDDLSAMYQSYEHAKASSGELNLEHRILLDGARVKHLEVRGRFGITPSGHRFLTEGTAQDVTETVQQRETLQHLVFQDALTSLPNRRSAEDILLREMDYCERHGQHLVLAFLDIDNFREVNDQHGYTLGDNLLKALAQRMRLLFNDTVVIAHAGGDEFIVLITRLHAEEGYYQQLNQLLAIISKPLIVDDIELALTASIGFTEFPQPISATREQLFRQAQQALFDAKNLGKNSLIKHDTGSQENARVLKAHLEDIRQALHAGEFVLYYQPKVHMKTGIVFGVEALIRWKKSSGELVQPNDFLIFLYNHPLEVELGDWVIRTALAQMREWKQQGLDIQVSVNVSSLQLLDETFVDKLSRDLNDYADISPSALQLEVLESSALNDLETIALVMQQSNKLGVSFALDDFGTGYSSLALLKNLPVSVLKIDRGFVRDMIESSDDLSIISAVVGMAKAFGLHVIAEGVENTEHGSLLLRLGCDQAQGYGIAKPMPADEVYDWVHSWKVDPAWQEQWPVDANNLPLVYAEAEHRRWVIELEQWLQNKRNEVPALDHHQCKVGLWIDGEKQSRFGMHAKFNHMINLHRDIHHLGQKAATLHATNSSEVALALLPEIWQLRDLFIAELKALSD